jgi:LacI family transcriptional regulator
VRQPLTEMGRRGAQVLLERFANRGKKYPAEIVTAPKLVVR